jgi:hypothetical protein
VLDGISIAVGADTITATSTGGLPLRYPMSVTWTGSRGVHIGDTRCGWGDILAFDPSTGDYQRCRQGSVELTITANHTSQTIKL